MNTRSKQIEQWLANRLDSNQFIITPLAGDASFRRYFRIQEQNKTFILMDAPPERENCRAFVMIDNFLLDNHIPVPQIYQQDIEQGFLLLDDFGDTLLLQALNPTNADDLYHKTIDILCQIQNTEWQGKIELPPFDAAFMRQEMMMLKDWFIGSLLELQLSTHQEQLLYAVFDELIAKIAALPYTFVHRDYQVKNLMCLPDGGIGVLDFQDAVYGPITYDLVSVLKDAYITWPRAKQEEWLSYYYNQATEMQIITDMSLEQLYSAYEFTGLQRHIKVIGIFARLFKRDGKAGYLKEIPRLIHYVVDALIRLDTMHEFLHLMKDELLPAFEQLKITQDEAIR